MMLGLRAIRRFPGMAFGPWALRPMLKQMREPGEHLVGWGLVQPATSAWSKTSAAMMSVVPIFGPLVSAMMISSVTKKRRLAVLTNRHLIMVRADAPKFTSQAVVFAEPLEVLEFEAIENGMGQEHTIIIHYGGAQPAAMEVVESTSRATERLREGLLELAGVRAEWLDDDAPPPGASPQAR